MGTGRPAYRSGFRSTLTAGGKTQVKSRALSEGRKVQYRGVWGRGERVVYREDRREERVENQVKWRRGASAWELLGCPLRMKKELLELKGTPYGERTLGSSGHPQSWDRSGLQVQPLLPCWADPPSLDSKTRLFKPTYPY